MYIYFFYQQTAGARYLSLFCFCDQMHRKPDQAILNKAVCGSKWKKIEKVLWAHLGIQSIPIILLRPWLYNSYQKNPKEHTSPKEQTKKQKHASSKVRGASPEGHTSRKEHTSPPKAATPAPKRTQVPRSTPAPRTTPAPGTTCCKHENENGIYSFHSGLISNGGGFCVIWLIRCCLLSWSR